MVAHLLKVSRAVFMQRLLKIDNNLGEVGAALILYVRVERYRRSACSSVARRDDWEAGMCNLKELLGSGGHAHAAAR